MARFNIINLLEYNSTQWVEIDPVEVFLFSHKESFNNYSKVSFIRPGRSRLLEFEKKIVLVI